MSRVSLCLILSIAFLFSFGLLMIFNTSSAQIIDRSLEINTHSALAKQILYGCFGIVFGLLLYRKGYEWFLKKSPLFLGFVVLLLVLLFVPQIGQTIHGARRWISCLGISFQPAECVKILLPAVYIYWLSIQKKEVSFRLFVKMLGCFAIPMGLILIQPDNGTTAILLAVLMFLFFITRIRWIYWALPFSLLLGLGVLAASQMPHVSDRIRIYFHPEQDLKGKGHQPYQAKIAVGSGGLFGRGLGESLQKLNYLPEARNDYIAAIFAEEMGFVGMLGLIALYASFTYCGFLIALRTKTQIGLRLAAVLTFLVAIQAFLNLGIVSGLLPSKGMTLPFFSQGGTSLVMNILIVFLLLDLERKRKVKGHGVYKTS